MLNSYDSISNDIPSNDQIDQINIEREKLEEDLKRTQEEITELRANLSLKLQHESELRNKLGYTLLNEIQTDIHSGLKTIKDSATYHKTVEVLSSAKEKTSSVVLETKDIVSKKLQDAKQSNAYKEVENKVGSLVSTMRDAFFFAAYGPPPISDEEFEEPINADKVAQHINN